MALPKSKKSTKSKQQAGKSASGISADKRKPLPYLLICCLVTVIIFSNSLNNGFCWDDGGYIAENYVIKDLSGKQGLKTVLTENYGGNYHPLTALSNAIEYKYFGLEPRPYHINNLILHVLNVCLVFFFILRLGASYEVSFMAALLFGIHPMRVESVAWIAERKDVLYTFFFLLSMIFYLRYIQNNFRTKYLFLSLLLFFLSCTSKSAAVCLPLVLIPLDYYKGRKINIRSLTEKIPFFIISVIFGVLALKSQGDVGSFADLTKTFNWFDRFFLVSYSVIFYIIKLFLPFNLSVAHIYPVKEGNMLPLIYYLAPLGIGLIILAVYKAGKWKKDLIFSLLFYLATVALVLQIIPVGKTVVSERYSYAPYIGLFFFLARFLGQFTENRSGYWKLKALPTLIFSGAVILFAILTWNRNKVWESDYTLFSDVIEKNPGVDFAYNNRGNLLFKQNLLKEALADYEKAVSINPNYTDAVYSRGVCREKLNDLQGALGDYNTALSLKPDYVYAYNNRGNVRDKLGDRKGAIEDYSRALEYNPNYADAYFNRGVIKDKLRDYQGSIADYTEFLKRRQDFHLGYFNRGNAKFFLKDFRGAIEDYDLTLSIKPDYPEAYFNRGYCKASSGDTTGACDDFRKALQLGLAKAQAMVEKYCP